MNIFYDGLIFQIQKAGGINRYFADLISGLPPDWRPTLAYYDRRGPYPLRHPNLKTKDWIGFRPRRWAAWLNGRVLQRSEMSKAHLLHPTYYELSNGTHFENFKCPMVLTAYDFVYAKYSKIRAGSEHLIKNQVASIERADHVICISRYTEMDLLDRIPAARGKTSVIHLGIPSEVSEPLTPAPSDERSFLHVGARSGYKNFSFLLRAFAAACSKRYDLRLLVAGAPLTEDELWQAHFLGITERIVPYVYPDEMTLKALYRKSLALLYPSIHEGFGIPPLEAMANKTIAVTANNTCLPEIVGDGGILLDPYAESDWTECILAIAEGKVERGRLIENGLARVKEFPFRKTIEQHIALYKSMA